MTKEYTPTPISTDDVELPQELIDLSERIAQNVHDVWAAGRIADGWCYGPQRDDLKKTHPCLIPYTELSEDEKEYDRRTSEETIRLILKMGFKITHP